MPALSDYQVGHVRWRGEEIEIALRQQKPKAEIPELASVKHVFVKAAARLNNRAENSHQPTRERERPFPRGLPAGRARPS